MTCARKHLAFGPVLVHKWQTLAEGVYPNPEPESNMAYPHKHRLETRHCDSGNCVVLGCSASAFRFTTLGVSSNPPAVFNTAHHRACDSVDIAITLGLSVWCCCWHRNSQCTVTGDSGTLFLYVPELWQTIRSLLDLWSSYPTPTSQAPGTWP